MKGPPHERSQATANRDGEQAGTYSDEVLEREAADEERKSVKHRSWSRAGTIEAIGWLKLYIAEIAPGIRANHRHRHRRKRPSECGALCEAKDIFAVFWLACPAGPRAKSIPLLAIIIPQIAQLCRCAICNPAAFARGVRRDMEGLVRAMASRANERNKGARALIRRYPAARVMLLSPEEVQSAPAIKPA